MGKFTKKINTKKEVEKVVKQTLSKMHIDSPEEKCLVYKLPNTAVTSAGTLAMISLIAQGTNTNQRIGDEIAIKRIELVYHTSQSSLAFSDIGNVVLLQDKDNDGALPSALYDDQFGGFVDAPYWSFTASSNGNELVKNENMHPSRYRELCRIPYHTQSSITGTSVVSKVHRKTMFFKRPLKVQYVGTGATIADTASGAILLGWVGQQSANTSTINCIVKIVYTDM